MLEEINVGDHPNDGAGDKLREAFIKINNNFKQLLTKEYIEAHYYPKDVIDGLLRGVVNQFTGTGIPDPQLGNIGDTYTQTVSGVTTSKTSTRGHPTIHGIMYIHLIL